MNIKLQTNRAALLLIVVALGGCSSWFTPMGDNKYECNRKENPNSPYCHSFRSMEEATANDIPDSRYDEKTSLEEADQRTGIAPKKPKPKKTRGSQSEGRNVTTEHPVAYADGDGSSSALPDGTPVRVGPVLQRTWIKSFDDNNDMLTSDLLVYKEVVPTHWAGRSPSYGTQGMGSSGTSGAYPHKPAQVQVNSTVSSYPINGVPAEQKSVNSDFNQPGETVSPDTNDASMPK